MFSFIFLFLLLTVISGNNNIIVINANANNPKIVKLTSPSNVKYTLVNEPSTRGDAPGKCACLGLSLAKIATVGELKFLGENIPGTSWIDKWQGNDYGGACIALFKGGAIAVPINNCNSLNAVLCDGQVPTACSSCQ